MSLELELGPNDLGTGHSYRSSREFRVCNVFADPSVEGVPMLGDGVYGCIASVGETAGPEGSPADCPVDLKGG